MAWFVSYGKETGNIGYWGGIALAGTALLGVLLREVEGQYVTFALALFPIANPEAVRSVPFSDLLVCCLSTGLALISLKPDQRKRMAIDLAGSPFAF